MRAVLLILILLPPLASATDVRGTISTSTVWTRRGSPYVLQGDVTVAWGTRLTLEPGVQVIAAPDDALRSGVDPQRVELIIDGTLVVRGTAARPVELTSRGGRGAWYGIRVRGGRGTEIDGALITQAHQGISLGMSATVKNTTVSAAAEDCIQVSWGTATLAGNELSGCGRREAGQPPLRVALQRATRSEPSVRGKRLEYPPSPTSLARYTPAPVPAAIAHAKKEEARARVAAFRPVGDTAGSFRRGPRTRPVPPREAREMGPDGALRVRPAPAPTAPLRLYPATRGSTGSTLAWEVHARVPRRPEPPECPGLRRWRQEQVLLQGALSGVWSPREPAPAPLLSPRVSPGEHGPAPPGPRGGLQASRLTLRLHPGGMHGPEDLHSRT